MGTLFCRKLISAACALFLACGAIPVQAAQIEHVTVFVQSTEGAIPDSVAKRIQASIAAIGGRVLVGRPQEVFQLNEGEYNKVLSDIVNRVVVGYVVADMTISYGSETDIAVTLQPVGQVIQSVSTEIDYGNLSEEAMHLIQSDLSGINLAMTDLLTGLPVDSVGWAESVSQSAGRDLLAGSLPEFQTNFEVESGVHTKVRVFLIPRGDIVRTGTVEFGRTTVPRVMLYHAVEETETAMRGLEGLPIDFVQRHSSEIAEDMKQLLMKDSFVKRYDISVNTKLFSGTKTKLLLDAVTDRWVVRAEAWLDVGRDGDRNTAADGLIGRYWGKKDLFFGQVRFYPGPMDWNVYGGWMHRIGSSIDAGYKYDFSEDSSHFFGRWSVGSRWYGRYDRDFKARNDEYALGYKVHNYMTLEYVYNNDDGKWLRLIANL